MIRDLDGSTPNAIAFECNIVYEYLRQQAVRRSPSEVARFQLLFEQGKVDSRVSQALAKVVADKKQFDKFLNRCCYIILDCWADSTSIFYISQLLDTLDAACQTKSYDRRRQQLVRLIAEYRQTKSYLQLKAIAAIITPQTANSDTIASTNEASEDSNSQHSIIVNSYLARYTYLYQHFILDDFELPHLTALINKLQQERQQKLEIQLSQHLIYRYRLKQFAKMKLLAKGAGNMITPVANPSLLSERAFRVAWQQYTRKKDRFTVLERAQHFVAENKLRNTYKVFKQDLYRFLTNKIVPRNSTYKFHHRLEEKLANIFAQSDAKPLNRSLILQTCRQLYSFLIVNPASPDCDDRFAKLIANLGTAQVMLILTKIVLICPESKSDLEQKICSIVTRYQLQDVRDLPWLIKALEHLSIAFSIYFGKIDVPTVKSVTNKP